jgi:hypothetical protein
MWRFTRPETRTACSSRRAASRQAGLSRRSGEALVSIWQDKLRYHYRATHRLRQDSFGVYLDVVTLSDDGGIFVTGLIKATWNA